MKLMVCMLALLLTSCVGYHYTNRGGVRVNNPKVFKYNKRKFTKSGKELIDTTVIYFKDSSYDRWSSPEWQTIYKGFVRFFNTGQVLFVSCDSFPSINKINDPNLGTPGYYIIRRTKIKIDMFQDLNGGQTGKYYGRIQPDGDIIFYEQRPETYFNSFSHLERAEGKDRFSKWKKYRIDSIKNYTPNW